MFRFFSKRSKSQNHDIVTAVVSQTSVLINDFHQRVDFRFKELSAQIKELEISLSQMETKILTKDLKDKQAYGLLHYKLHEAKSARLGEEIIELETALNLKKANLKDQ